jgi:hypothetical protein
MPRLSVPLTQAQHEAIKAKSEQTGVPQAEVARRLLLLWLVDDLELPTGDNYRALVDSIVEYRVRRVDV